jgi:hypothetical protein
MSNITRTNIPPKSKGDTLTAAELNTMNEGVNILLGDIVTDGVTPSHRLRAGLATGSLYVINLQAG